MESIDKIVGMDEARPRHDRAPLWKRAIWHALKSLVRKHPTAALSAAGSGLGYAVKAGASETMEAAGEAVGLKPASPEIPELRPKQLTNQQKHELIDSLQPEEREQLAKLAKL